PLEPGNAALLVLMRQKRVPSPAQFVGGGGVRDGMKNEGEQEKTGPEHLGEAIPDTGLSENKTGGAKMPPTTVLNGRCDPRFFQHAHSGSPQVDIVQPNPKKSPKLI
ncbi:MAG: hypothetical protein ACO3RK_07400, partial [Luteolibacter sp.]